jgi:hypothetical protein
MRMSIGTTTVIVLLISDCLCCVDLEIGQRDERVRMELDLLVGAQDAFVKVFGRTPTSIDEMAPPMCQDERCPLGGIPIDPWGHAYGSRMSNGKLRFFSVGRDGVESTADDWFSK